MKTYEILYAEDIPHYGRAEIRATDDDAAIETAMNGRDERLDLCIRTGKVPSAAASSTSRTPMAMPLPKTSRSIITASKPLQARNPSSGNMPGSCWNPWSALSKSLTASLKSCSMKKDSRSRSSNGARSRIYTTTRSANWRRSRHSYAGHGGNHELLEKIPVSYRRAALRRVHRRRLLV